MLTFEILAGSEGLTISQFPAELETIFVIRIIRAASKQNIQPGISGDPFISTRV